MAAATANLGTTIKIENTVIATAAYLLGQREQQGKTTTIAELMELTNAANLQHIQKHDGPLFPSDFTQTRRGVLSQTLYSATVRGLVEADEAPSASVAAHLARPITLNQLIGATKARISPAFRNR